MNDTVKVEVINEFWYNGRHYTKGECLFFTQEVLNNIGLDNFEIIKSVKNPCRDKMIRSPDYSK